MTLTGKTIVDLTRGELDRLPPPIFIEAASRALLARTNGYTDTAGLPALRDRLADFASAKFGMPVRREQLAVTAGAKPALYHALRAILDPGDEVIVPTPYWTTFPEQVRLAGGIPVFVDLSQSGYAFSAAAFASAISDRTKAIILNSPHNPTGQCISDKELAGLVTLADRCGAYILFDQCYQDLIYPMHRGSRLGETLGSFGHAVVIDSFSKPWALTGWRIGYVCADPASIRAITAIQTHTTSNPSSIAQYALLSTLDHGGAEEYVAAVRQDLADRCVWVAEAFAGIALVSVALPQAGFFIFVDVRRLLDLSPGASIDALCEDLLRECDVLVVPGTAFGEPGGFRLSFGGNEAAVRDGVGRVAGFLRDLQSRG